MIPIQEQIAEVEREIKLRKKVYPRWIDKGQLTASAAAKHTANMEAVLQTLIQVQKKEILI